MPSAPAPAPPPAQASTEAAPAYAATATSTCPRLTVYLAARYSRKRELRGYAEQLRERDWEVVSSWLDIDDEGDPAARAVEADRHAVPEGAGSYAARDLADIREADLFVLFAEAPGAATRGGRLVEYGFALREGCECVIVGRPETIFHRLPEVRLYPDWESCLDALGTGDPAKLDGDRCS